MGTRTPLTDGEAYGRVELRTDQDTYVTELSREDDGIVRQGDHVLSEERDRVCAALFAFLDEDNEVRRAVRNEENLEAVLTRPLQFERIDEQIADLTRERDNVDDEIVQARDAARRLPAVQEQVTTLENRLDSLQTEHEQVESPDADPDIATKRDALSAARAEHDRIEDRIVRLEDTIEHARERLSERREELDALELPGESDLDADLAATREALHEIERDLELLQAVYTANKRVFDEDRVDLLAKVTHGIVDDELSCWVCGQVGTHGDIEAHLAGLFERIVSRQADADEYRQQLADLEDQQRAGRRAERAKRDLQEAIAQLEQTVADREASLEAARTQREELSGRITSLSADVEDTDDHLTDLKSEIKYTEAALEDAREEVDSLGTRAGRRDHLERQRRSIVAEIEGLRSRKATIKHDTRMAFEDAIQDIIDRFDPGFDGARLTGAFDLVIARDGRETSLDALSEGEVELMSIMVALAGYEAFDVSDRVPVILLDGVGSFASDNLATLVGYLADRVPYVVTTSYPEQGTLEGHVVDPGEWVTIAENTGSTAVGS